MKKKGLIVAAVAIGVVTVGIFVTIFYLTPAREETRASDSKQLSVDHVFDGMKVKNGTVLKGKYTGPDDAKLYYLVSSEDKHVIGSDAITTESDKTFTVNLDLATSNYTNKRGEIKIYSQNAQGQVVDVVNIKVTLD